MELLGPSGPAPRDMTVDVSVEPHPHHWGTVLRGEEAFLANHVIAIDICFPL